MNISLNIKLHSVYNGQQQQQMKKLDWHLMRRRRRRRLWMSVEI